MRGHAFVCALAILGGCAASAMATNYEHFASITLDAGQVFEENGLQVWGLLDDSGDGATNTNMFVGDTWTTTITFTGDMQLLVDDPSDSVAELARLAVRRDGTPAYQAALSLQLMGPKGTISFSEQTLADGPLDIAEATWQNEYLDDFMGSFPITQIVGHYELTQVTSPPMAFSTYYVHIGGANISFVPEPGCLALLLLGAAITPRRRA